MGRSTLLVLAAVVACCAVADAKPRASRRVAVLDFDGSQRLANAGRTAVLSALGEEATIVPANKWNDALAHASGHGPDRWRQASGEVNVDAVIEGWVQQEGHRNKLVIAVRDALTGNEIRTFSITLDDRGVSGSEARKLASQLHNVLDRIDESDDKPAPPIDRPRETEPAADDPPETSAKPPATETRTVFEDEPPPPRLRFEVAGGAYVAARHMAFSHGTDGTGALPVYPGHADTGLAVHATAFPLPRRERDGALSGPGIALDLHKSLTSTTAIGGYTLSELAWEIGLHYRLPIASFMIDFDVDGGSLAYKLFDRPQSNAIPNASYSYLGVGGHVDFAATHDVTLGAGARYIYLLGIGEMGEPDWYGAGVASGVALDARGAFDLNELLYVEAVVAYRRIAVGFDGSGTVTQMTGRMNVIDSALSGAVNLGARF